MLRLLAARPPALRCLRLGVPSAARSVLRAGASPSGARVDQGLVHRVPRPGYFTNGDDEISQVPGGPFHARALLFDPGETSAPGHHGAPVLPSAFFTASALARTSLSGLDRTAHELAVYASQPGSPPGHARLASGWWPAVPGRGSTPAGSHRTFPTHASMGLPPPPSFPGAQRIASVVLAFLWNRVLQSLTARRAQILQRIRDSFESAHSDLAARVSRLALGTEREPLLAAVASCRANALAAVDELESWLTPVDSIDLPPFTMHHACEAALDLVLRLQRGTSNRPELDFRCELLIKGHYIGDFVDIWFILLDNADRHSPRGLADARVTCRCTGTCVNFEVTNPLSPEARTALPVLDFKTVQDSELARRAQTEGGTGWYKLVNILRRSLSQRGDCVRTEVRHERELTIHVEIDTSVAEIASSPARANGRREGVQDSRSRR